MDALDSILLEAWNRISGELRRKRIRALKRSRRRFKGVLTRPMREWCLVIRASDTRLSPPSPRNESRDPQVNRALKMDWLRIAVDPIAQNIAYVQPLIELDREAIRQHREHTLTITGSLIRELTKPISIPWPGVTYHQAALICGREYKTIKYCVKRGMFSIYRQHEAGFPLPEEYIDKRGPRQARGKLKGRPYLWTPSPIDPNNFEGRTPHPVWGTLWQTLWQKLPEKYTLTVMRVPKFRVRKGTTVFRGWDFICPGRMNDEGDYQGCGRRCTYLYGPQRVWTLADALGLNDPHESGFEMPDDSQLAGQWYPGFGDPVASAGPRSFACKECWGVRSACMANHNGWNEFISQISGGLLYGRDVPRLPAICSIERKKRPYRWKRSRKDIEAERHEANIRKAS